MRNAQRARLFAVDVELVLRRVFHAVGRTPRQRRGFSPPRPAAGCARCSSASWPTPRVVHQHEVEAGGVAQLQHGGRREDHHLCASRMRCAKLARARCASAPLAGPPSRRSPQSFSLTNSSAVFWPLRPPKLKPLTDEDRGHRILRCPGSGCAAWSMTASVRSAVAPGGVANLDEQRCPGPPPAGRTSGVLGEHDHHAGHDQTRRSASAAACGSACAAAVLA